jgi:hypothetical protein
MSHRDLPPDHLRPVSRQHATRGETDVIPLDGEPWVQVADGKALANWSAEDEIRYNQRNRQSEKLCFFRQVFDFLKENEIAGDYHEYGCHRARTFRMALTEARRKNFHDMMFWAFDSFTGLPEPVNATSVGRWKQGALATSEEDFLRLISEHGVYPSQVRGDFTSTRSRRICSAASCPMNAESLWRRSTATSMNRLFRCSISLSHCCSLDLCCTSTICSSGTAVIQVAA